MNTDTTTLQEKINKFIEKNPNALKDIPPKPKTDVFENEVLELDVPNTTLQISKKGVSGSKVIVNGQPVQCIVKGNLEFNLETNTYDLTITILDVKLEMIE